MKQWFTSDLHFGHAGVIDYCKRPFESVEHMDSALIDKWNKKVKDEDVVYVLGDVSFHKPSVGIEILKKLKGRKILIQGNHDKYSLTQYLSAGFNAVFQEALIVIAGMKFILSHYPYAPMHNEEDLDPYELRYLDRRPEDTGKFLLCGHVHTAWQTKGRMLNVGVDQWDFEPVSVSEIESHFNGFRAIANDERTHRV